MRDLHAYVHTPDALDLCGALPLLDPTNKAADLPRIWERTAAMGPLKGVKVIDMTTVLMGPYATKPAYDDLIQGATALPALMAQTGDGVPRYVPNALVDRIVGLTAVGAICASLVHRDKTGQGQRVDIPMFETMASFVMGDHMGGLTYEPPLDKGGYARHLSPDRRPYKTSDGYICVIV